MLDERRDLIDGMSAEADQLRSRYAKRIENLLMLFLSAIHKAIAHAKGPTEEVHHRCIQIQNADGIGIFRRKPHRLQAAAAHADGNAFCRKSIGFPQVFRKTHLRVGVDVRTDAVDIFEICQMISTA